MNTDILYGGQRKLLFSKFAPDYLFTKAYGFGEIDDLRKTTENHCDELKVFFLELSFKDNNCALVMNNEETQNFEFLRKQYNLSLQGKIAGERKFLRMLYLSAVTITTLGYGDIISTSDITRSLVAIESTLGILIMVFFKLYCKR